MSQIKGINFIVNKQVKNIVSENTKLSIRDYVDWLI